MLIIAGRIIPKIEPLNEPTPILVHALTDCEYSENVHFQLSKN